MAKRYCGSCGRELSGEDQFCPSCGRPAHETAQVSTPEANVPVPPLQMAGDGGAAVQGNVLQRHPFVMGCLGLIVLFILVMMIIGAAIGASSSGTADNGNGNGAGSEQAQSAGQQEEQANAEPAVEEEAVQVADEEVAQEEPVEEEPPKERPAPESRTYSVGDNVKVGDVSYMVTGAQTVTELKDPYGFDKPLTGNFIIVGFRFTNEGSEPATVSDIGMYLYDGQGRQYETDSEAAFYLPDDQSMFLLDRVNPGLSTKVKTIYSVPPGASDFELEVSSGFFARESERIKLGI